MVVGLEIGTLIRTSTADLRHRYQGTAKSIRHAIKVLVHGEFRQYVPESYKAEFTFEQG